jgi:hypothetical protein
MARNRARREPLLTVIEFLVRLQMVVRVIDQHNR